jgi:hypothetical protein
MKTRNKFKRAVCTDRSSKGNGKKHNCLRAEYYFISSDGNIIRRRKRFPLNQYKQARQWIKE